MKSLSTLDMYCESKYHLFFSFGYQNATKKTARRTPRRGPPRQGRREIYDPIDVGMLDVESVHQDRTEMEINSPPRSRQRVQSEAENVPPPPPFDMDDLRLLRQQIQELRA